MLLTPKQRRFVAEYLIDLNGTQAAIRAGYSRKTAAEQASRLLTNVKVSAAVAEGQAQLAEKHGVTAERIVAELAKLGFANMQDYMRVDGEGTPRLDFGSLSRDQAAALAEVTVDEYMARDPDGADEDGKPRMIPARKVKFKLADKRASLVDLGRHLGMFVDKHEHTGKDGAALVPVLNVTISGNQPHPSPKTGNGSHNGGH